MNVMMNIIVITNTMTTPDGKLKVTLKNSPITDDTMPINAEVKIIVDNLLVNKYAVDAGVINNETTKITPTVCSEATVTNVNKIISV